MICAVFIPVMFVSRIEAGHGPKGGGVALLLEQLAQISRRPRYAFMLLNLIAQVAKTGGRAGPLVVEGNVATPLRDWLCDALTPMGGRDPKRLALTERVERELRRGGRLPNDAAQAARMIDEEVRDRVRASGKTNLSRAVTELVNAGLLKRHYQGYCVDHLNRGAQRQAVYTLAGKALCLLVSDASARPKATRQGELPLL